MTHYYAFEHTYGIGTTDTDGDIIGTLYIFDTKHERDSWINKDVWDGNFHRATISYKDARNEIVSSLCVSGFFNSRTEGKNTSTEKLIKMYRKFNY